MIIPCEKEYAEERLVSGFTRQGSFDDLKILAKYFRFLGKNTPQTEKALIEFCEKFSYCYNQRLFEKKIKNAVNDSKKEELRIFSPIGVTKKELESIRKIQDFRKQKILFIMLVTAKMFGMRTKNGILYCNVSLTEILRLAKVKALAQEKMDLTRALNVSGLINTNGNSSYEILFLDEKQDAFEILVTEKNDIISHLLFQCPKCGKEIPIGAKSRKMCNECLKKNELERKRKWWNDTH
jgi:hypothetical protein